MKKIIALFLALICLNFFGCSNADDNKPKSENVSIDYGTVIDLAKAEFSEIFKELENLQTKGISTMAKTDNANEVIVQIKYSSSNGEGVYGFLYNIDDPANPKLIDRGEDITIDNLLK
ncbi:MAG: hypothetical protein IKK74_10780 [Clostridia bacterium]|nr:hypothetical protein [Clostridia bacterium]